MHSCLYEGRVHHLRREPVEHRFSYRLAMAFLDLAELDSIVGRSGYFSARRFAAASFQETDHLASFPQSPPADADHSLATTIRNYVAENAEKRFEGPIRLLTQLRYCGHYFSPLNLFYCYAADGKQIEYVVAEVSNTPWNERHLYLLHPKSPVASRSDLRYQHPKAFHVSPFMGMDATYDWRLSEPAEQLTVGIVSRRGDDAFFQANMELRRSELSRSGVRRMLVRYPLMSSRIVAAIYWQAFLLWKKKCPFFPHPQSTVRPSGEHQA